MGGEPRLQAGVARADITPPVGIDLGGFYTREGPSTHVLDRLTATALVLQSGERMQVIVACDLLSFRGEVGADLRRRVASALRLPEEYVLLNASHTHSGPVLGSPFRTSVSGEESISDVYRANLFNMLVGL